jgi:2-dehydro-3-deoxyphosphogalactonate aldolase
LRHPLVAILRGIRPDEVTAAVAILIEAGFEAIEIPLNSPAPFTSIARAVRFAPPNMLIGAGTVLDPAEVDRLAECGGRLLVAPNVAPAVIARAAGHGMVTIPGVLTPTEAFAALAAGASALKFFPANLLGPAGISATRQVLPAGTRIGAVGGVTEADFARYGEAGVEIFGLGSSLYRAGPSMQQLRESARLAITAWSRVRASQDRGPGDKL